MTPAAESVSDELKRRHHAALTVVGAMLALTVLLVALAVAGVRLLLPASLAAPTLDITLRITILIFGLGVVALRRTRFASMRLQDIAALRGPSGLLATLERTTVLLALLGGAIAVMGFLLTLMTDSWLDALCAGGIAVAILFYCYPRRAAWQRVLQATERPGGLDTSPAKGKPA